MLISAALFIPSASAQDNPIAVPNSQPPPPNQDPNRQGGSIKVDVSLVVLHTTVLDDRQRFADGLKQENFRIFEDKVEQKLSVFKREDVPVSMGLVIDNSGSMREKRPRVNEAALTLVQASNPRDEARSEEHTSELQSQSNLVCRLLLEKKKDRSPPQPRRAARPTARASVN